MHLACTGALTNVALLLIMFPEVASFIEQIVLMGGAIGSGNTNPCAEFNMQVISLSSVLFSTFDCKSAAAAIAAKDDTSSTSIQVFCYVKLFYYLKCHPHKILSGIFAQRQGILDLCMDAPQKFYSISKRGRSKEGQLN